MSGDGGDGADLHHDQTRRSATWDCWTDHNTVNLLIITMIKITMTTKTITTIPNTTITECNVGLLDRSYLSEFFKNNNNNNK